MSLAPAFCPACVTLIHEGLQLAAFEHGRRSQQAACQDVDGADVSVEQIHGIDALAADLGVEIAAAAGVAAAF